MPIIQRKYVPCKDSWPRSAELELPKALLGSSFSLSHPVKLHLLGSYRLHLCICVEEWNRIRLLIWASILGTCSASFCENISYCLPWLNFLANKVQLFFRFLSECHKLEYLLKARVLSGWFIPLLLLLWPSTEVICLQIIFLYLHQCASSYMDALCGS